MGASGLRRNESAPPVMGLGYARATVVMIIGSLSSSGLVGRFVLFDSLPPSQHGGVGVVAAMCFGMPGRSLWAQVFKISWI